MPLGSIAGRDSVFASLSRLRPVSTGRLPLTALAEERRAGLFRFCAARKSRGDVRLIYFVIKTIKKHLCLSNL
jgi:hypothetical protein